MDISKFLKILMLNKDVKQLDVASKFGMSKNTFNNLLQRNNFKLNDIIKIADILGYDVNLQFIDRCNDRAINTLQSRTTATGQSTATLDIAIDSDRTIENDSDSAIDSDTDSAIGNDSAIGTESDTNRNIDAMDEYLKSREMRSLS